MTNKEIIEKIDLAIQDILNDFEEIKSKFRDFEQETFKELYNIKELAIKEISNDI